MFERDSWSGPLEIHAADDDKIHNMLQQRGLDKAALLRPLDETERSWLLSPEHKSKMNKKMKNMDLGCIIISRKIFLWMIATIAISAFTAGFATLIAKTVPRHHHKQLHSRPPQGALVFQCSTL
ncbi:hypothetical protein AHAS_Ahas11G0268200 [Arachis hypogaea]